MTKGRPPPPHFKWGGRGVSTRVNKNLRPGILSILLAKYCRRSVDPAPSSAPRPLSVPLYTSFPSLPPSPFPLFPPPPAPSFLRTSFSLLRDASFRPRNKLFSARRHHGRRGTITTAAESPGSGGEVEWAPSSSVRPATRPGCRRKAGRLLAARLPAGRPLAWELLTESRL